MTPGSHRGGLAPALILAVVAPFVFADSARAQSPDPIAVHGFVSIADVYNFNRPPSGKNGLRVFDFDHATLKIDVAELTILKPVSAPRRFGFRIDLEAGASIPKVSASAGLFRDAQTGEAHDYDLQQAFVSYIAPIGSGLRLDAGKFVTPLGFEVIEGWDGYNDNYSRSLLFGYAIPFTHTGMRLSYTFTPKVSVAGAVVQGWDNFTDNNSGKTVLGGITLTPTSAFTLAFNAVTGPELPANTHDRRTVLDLVATWKINAETTLGFNLDHGGERHGAPNGAHAAWHGGAAYLRRVLTGRVAVSVRGETFHDVNGARTGTPQKVAEFTVTPEVRLTPHVLLRGDFRVDRSDQPVFETRTAARTIQKTVSVNLIGYF